MTHMWQSNGEEASSGHLVRTHALFSLTEALKRTDGEWSPVTETVNGRL